MILSDKQWEFYQCFAMLILYAKKQGYKLTPGDMLAKTGHKENSNHYIGLAADTNLFIGGEYVTSSQHPAWGDLHEYWEALSTMSAPIIISDANHFSFEHNGVW